MAARGKKAAPKKQLLPLISSPGEQGAGEKSLFALKPANLLDSTSRAPTIEGMKLKVRCAWPCAPTPAQITWRPTFPAQAACGAPRHRALPRHHHLPVGAAHVHQRGGAVEAGQQ
jgi:hypothetical protein